MATTKSYTDLSQSKTLSKILPLESADLFWQSNLNSSDRQYLLDMGEEEYFDIEMNFEHCSIGNYDIPAWSLAALLDVIPKHIKDCNVLRIDISNNDFAIWYDEIGFGVNNNLPDITMESAVDACYELILKLHELKML